MHQQTITDMDVDVLNPLTTSLRSLKLPSVEKFIDSFKGTGDMIFASFEIYDNSHPVSRDLMKALQRMLEKAWT